MNVIAKYLASIAGHGDAIWVLGPMALTVQMQTR